MRIQISTERRHKDDKKIAIFAECGAMRLNIWDLPETEMTQNVLNAIQSAVERGIMLQRDAVRNKINEMIQIKVEVKL